MIKFLATSWLEGGVTEMTIDRETEKSVFLNGREFQKRTSFENFFDTRKEADAFICGVLEAKKEHESLMCNLKKSFNQDEVGK